MQNSLTFSLWATICSFVRRVNESSGAVTMTFAQEHSLFLRGSSRAQPLVQLSVRHAMHSRINLIGFLRFLE